MEDEIVQLAVWLRDRRTYSFQWNNDENISDVEPDASENVYLEIKKCFESSIDHKYPKYILRQYFAKNNVLYIEDLTRVLFACYRIRYGEKEAAFWGVRALHWAAVDVDPSEEETIFRARMFSSRALKLFAIISRPKSLRSVHLILKVILRGLIASQKRWQEAPKDEQYSKEDIHLSMSIRGIEALVSLVHTEDWNRTLFRMMLVSFWISIALLHSRVAKIQIAARKLLRAVLAHKGFFLYLFGHSKNATGKNKGKQVKESSSAQMFWSFYKLFEGNFTGIQSRLLNGLIHTVGEDSPVCLNTDSMMILTSLWMIRCDALHDVHLESRIAANITFFLPYACAVLDPQYFGINVLQQHITGASHANSKRKHGKFAQPPGLGSEGMCILF